MNKQLLKLLVISMFFVAFSARAGSVFLTNVTNQMQGKRIKVNLLDDEVEEKYLPEGKYYIEPGQKEQINREAGTIEVVTATGDFTLISGEDQNGNKNATNFGEWDSKKKRSQQTVQGKNIAIVVTPNGFVQATSTGQQVPPAQ